MSIHIAEEVNAAIDDVWDLVGDFGGLLRWNPFVACCSSNGEGAGALRTVLTPDGREIVEQIEVHDAAARVLRYRVVSAVPEIPVVGMSVKITLAELAKERTRVTWDGSLPAEIGEVESLVQSIASGFRARINALQNALEARARS
jgi:hypothetical protein